MMPLIFQMNKLQSNFDVEFWILIEFEPDFYQPSSWALQFYKSL